ncbi:anti-virulence regulator CigR family protein [uncultured Pseudomonas sp.]|uniref:anti-virulence regulator CigR family protein n=1 Tax=uncultured Pseudomonas sp. TaxID=114707 RepID=UPI0025D92074|nr:anti-virulence regulator CigR family protein [uncultured Pseudomonas sp.]
MVLSKVRPGMPRAGPRPGGPGDLGPARERIRALRGQIGPGGELPPGLRLERGRPLPPGYGRPLPPGIVKQLPDYPGYQWRQLGTDVVLIAVGTGLVYAILQGVLD